MIFPLSNNSVYTNMDFSSIPQRPVFRPIHYFDTKVNFYALLLILKIKKVKSLLYYAVWTLLIIEDHTVTCSC